jgi:hypothetical protein
MADDQNNRSRGRDNRRQAVEQEEKRYDERVVHIDRVG